MLEKRQFLRFRPGYLPQSVLLAGFLVAGMLLPIGAVARAQTTAPPSPVTNSDEDRSSTASQDQTSSPSTTNRAQTSTGQNQGQQAAQGQTEAQAQAGARGQLRSQGQQGAAATRGAQAEAQQPAGQQQPSRQRGTASAAGQTRGDLQAQQPGGQQAEFQRQGARQGLGLRFNEQTEGGLSIAEIQPDGIAAQAGFQAGDRIVSVDGRQITDPRQFQTYIRGQFGRRVPVVIERNGQRYTVQLTPGQPEMQGAWLGVYLQDGQGDQQGPRIVSVYPSGPAARAGLRRGDIVQQLNGQQISSTPDLIAAIEGMEPQSRAEFQVLRDGQAVQVPVVLGNREHFVSFPQQPQRQGQGQDYNQGQFNQDDEYANVPPYAMQLEHDRRMAEQHQRIETELIKLQEEVRQMREVLNQRR